MKRETIVEFFRSKIFAGIIIGICIMLVAIFVFEVGVSVGYHEAIFSNRWNQNYSQNFSGLNSFGFSDPHTPNPDGTLGKIVSITTDSSGSTTLIMMSKQKLEEKILITSNTILRDNLKTISVSDLSAGAYAVVIGTPDTKGEIVASLLRLVPSPTALTASSTNP